LEEILGNVPLQRVEELLVGIESSDDAAIYQLTDDLALVQTVDFFTPIVDDPYLFGQIAAANSLSDVYAMGGEPKTAMNIVSFWPKLGYEVLEQILKGGRDKVEEAGATIVGGHTVEDKEPKYGLAVTGLIHPQRIISNSAAKPGDLLVLTKPLGMGILATALKGGELEEKDMMDAIDSARELNAAGCRAMQETGVRACTDVTGFGFLGHLFLMLKASGTGAEIVAQNVPIWGKAIGFAEMGMVPGGAHENRDFLKGNIKFASSVDQPVQDILFDPQTSGGLVICVSPDKLDHLLSLLKEEGIQQASMVGTVNSGPAGAIKVV
jgi:selenide,water dikinase